jgi:5-methylcytosine-specific restriction endonuclease McrA
MREWRRWADGNFKTFKHWCVWLKTNGHCWYCGDELELDWEEPGPYDFTLEHQIPKRWGGSDNLWNLVPACRQCNRDKGTMTVEEFRTWHARRNVPDFTPAHRAYLQKLGIPLPPDFPCYRTVVFWGERDATTDTTV